MNSRVRARLKVTVSVRIRVIAEGVMLKDVNNANNKYNTNKIRNKIQYKPKWWQ